MSGATLFRTNGPAWRFEWDHSCGMYVHRTIRGTVYEIIGVHCSKPIWIGHLGPNGMWYTDEARIGAEYIQFDNGGEYWFRRQSE